MFILYKSFINIPEIINRFLSLLNLVCRDCLGRTPFASLIAVLIQLVGVGVFCVALFKALDITLRGIFDDLFNFSVKWMENLLIIFIAIAIAMGLYAIILLIFGFLATGATREKLYSGTKCIMGGRIGAAFVSNFQTEK